LRQYAKHIGYSGHFSIYDEDDQTALISECIKERDLPRQRFASSLVLNKISACKNILIDYQNYFQHAHDYFEKTVAEIYQSYQTRLEKANALDFDDLLMQAVRLLQQEEKVLAQLQERFQHVLVDEYQDTNHAQYVLVKLLAGAQRNLAVVGDDDQSIYGWRGADLKNILDFERDYPECKVVRLEQNYRSTQNILEAAWSVVKNNFSRKEKKLWTENTTGEKIKLRESYDEKQEAQAVVEKIRELRSRFQWPDFVILYRTNAQSRVIEQALRDAGMPYVIVGGVRFYERKEI
jgi:DNA helicase-2/ATP-dependent DNA helicase PcrA